MSRAWPYDARQWPGGGRQWPLQGGISVAVSSFTPSGHWLQEDGETWLLEDGRTPWMTEEGLSTYVEIEELAPRTYLSRTDVQSIPSTTVTQALWDIASDDVGAFNSNSAGIWMVPSGYTRMAVAAYGRWAVVNSGMRTILLQNSADENLFADKRQAMNETQATMYTGFIPVNSGQIYSLKVYQDKGSNVNWNTTANDKVRIEITWLP
jgi:hypothetical protein